MSQTIVITGANRGLGLELTRQYLAAGHQVIALVRSISSALVSLESGAALEIHQGSLCDDESLARVASCLADRDLDLLINNAGTMGYLGFGDGGMEIQQFGSFDRQEWGEVMDINLYTPMALAELLAEPLARSSGGRIVNMSSKLGSITANTAGGLYAYRASKAALNAVTRSLALDLASRNIVVTAVTPGWVKTDMGGPQAELDAEVSIAGLRKVIDGLEARHSGRFLTWEGEELPW